MVNTVKEQKLPQDFDIRLPIIIAAMLAVYAAVLLVGIFNEVWASANWPMTIGILFLLTIIAIMNWPMAGTRRYLSYKPPLFIFAIVAELWIVVAGLTLRVPESFEARAIGFQIALVLFWAFTVMCAWPKAHGEYRPGLQFRPDLVFPGGCHLVRGEIFIALGLKLMFSPEPFELPTWNWWGLVWAIIAMVVLVALRGLFKMRQRRARMLGLTGWMGKGMAGIWPKEALMWVGLVALMYGFVNVFMGKVPFTWAPAVHRGGVAFLAISAIIIIPIRGWYKLSLPEGAESWSQRIISQLILWIGVVFLFYGFFTFFMGFYPTLNTGSYGFPWGIWVFILGFLTFIPFRTLTLRNELAATIRIMVGTIADKWEPERKLMMGYRIRALTSMPVAQRDEQVKLMVKGLSRLPQEKREAMMKTQIDILSGLEPEKRRLMMASMDKATLGGA